MLSSALPVYGDFSFLPVGTADIVAVVSEVTTRHHVPRIDAAEAVRVRRDSAPVGIVDIAVADADAARRVNLPSVVGVVRDRRDDVRP